MSDFEKYGSYIFDTFRIVSVAAISVAFCVLVAVYSVSGWNLAMMSVVSLVGIGGVISVVEESKNEPKREG